MPSAQDIASKLAYISGQLAAGGTNKQMLEWWGEYKKLDKELKVAKATQATAPDTTAEETRETTAKEARETTAKEALETTAKKAPETTAKEAPETTAPETTAEASQTKARKIAFIEPSEHGNPDES